MFKEVDHIGIATRDIEASLETLRKLADITVGEYEDVPRYHLKAVMLKVGEVPIELIQPTSEESTVHSFIERRGEGIHHITFRVDDVAAALERCKSEGVRTIDQQPREGYGDSKVAFLHPKATLGVLMEVCERPEGKDRPPYALPEE